MSRQLALERSNQRSNYFFALAFFSASASICDRLPATQPSVRAMPDACRQSSLESPGGIGYP
jgi:hypothetical protein